MSEALVSFRRQSIFRLNEKLEHLSICFEQLTAEDIWWRPNPASNSIGNLILHLCGNIRQYIISSLGHFPDTRDRDAEFAVVGGWSAEELFQEIAGTIQEASKVIDQASERELLRTRSVQGFDFDGLGIVIHVVEHLSYHTGQIAYITKMRQAKNL
ncbi:MAG: DinB family protein, partial [Bacteroidota bacterium]